MANRLEPTEQIGSRPVPDPTVLTTQAQERSLLSLRELLSARMDGVDKLIDILQHGIATRHQDIEEAVTHLQKLHEEKFRSIAIQFAERDTRTEQTSRDSKVAVDAALQAAKEAVGEQNKSSALAIAKSEAATTKQMDQIGAIIQATTTGISDKIDDIKERITAIEGRRTGVADGWGYLAGLIGAIAAVAAIIALILKP